MYIKRSKIDRELPCDVLMLMNMCKTTKVFIITNLGINIDLDNKIDIARNNYQMIIPLYNRIKRKGIRSSFHSKKPVT